MVLKLFEVSGLHSFLPIDRLVGRCAHCSKTVNDENVLVIVPLVELKLNYDNYTM